MPCSYTWNANGNQATRTIAGQLNTLTWDSEHRLATVEGPDGDHSFTYDADGARLLRQTPAGTTLYIEAHEITAPTSGTTTAVRSYGFAGQPVATRTPTGLDCLVTDNQGSLEQTIPAGSATAEHTRTYFPYGKLRTGGQPDTGRPLRRGGGTRRREHPRSGAAPIPRTARRDSPPSR